MAKKEKSGIEKGNQGRRSLACFPGCDPSHHIYQRPDWDRPLNFDESKPPGKTKSSYNYYHGRMEFHFLPLETQPLEVQAEYYPGGLVPGPRGSGVWTQVELPPREAPAAKIEAPRKFSLPSIRSGKQGA